MAVMQVSFGVYMGIVECVKRSVGTRGRAPLSGKPRELPRVSSAHQPPRNTTHPWADVALLPAKLSLWLRLEILATYFVHKAST